MPKKYIPTQEELQEIISLYNSGISLTKMSKQLHRSKETLSKILKENNIHIRMTNETSRKYCVDETYFEKINTSEKAYWLGFLYADGFIESKRESGSQKFGITLSQIDRGHVEKFKQCLNATYEIKDYKGSGYNKDGWMSRLLITSQKMVDDLKALGCVENKTKILKFPTEKQVPKDFQFDFIRGYIDGDGTIYYSNGAYRFGCLGTYDMILRIKEILQLDTEILQEHPERCTDIYTISGAALKYFKSLYNMYDKATIYLDRKYELYQKIKEKYVERQGIYG